MESQRNNVYTGVAGKRLVTDGTFNSPRLGNDGSIFISQSYPKYYDLCTSKNIFSMVLPAWATTIAAGNVVAASANANTQFALWNPKASTKDLVLLKFGVWVISGTLPISGIIHSYSETCPTDAHNVAYPIQNHFIGATDGNSMACVARGRSIASNSTALNGTTALKVIRSSNMTASAGVFAQLFQLRCIEHIDGDIVIPPGICWVPTWRATGTTLLGGYSITWAEIDRV